MRSPMSANDPQRTNSTRCTVSASDPKRLRPALVAATIIAIRLGWSPGAMQLQTAALA